VSKTQSGNSKLLPDSQAYHNALPRSRDQIDHSKRPKHDRFGREIPPYDPEKEKGPRDSEGNPICGGKLRGGKLGAHGDGLCHKSPLINGRCMWHGGKSLAGPASPRYIHGRNSRYPFIKVPEMSKYDGALSSNLQEAYLRSLNDDNRLALDNEMAVIDARLIDLMKRIDVDMSRTTWEDAKNAVESLAVAARTGDQRVAAEKLAQLRSLFAHGNQDFELWEAYLKATEQRRKLVETEQKRLVLAQQTMTSQQAMTFLNNIVAVIKIHVSDPIILSAIARDVARLTTSTALNEAKP
jgi:hypothetical protein